MQQNTDAGRAYASRTYTSANGLKESTYTQAGRGSPPPYSAAVHAMQAARHEMEQAIEEALLLFTQRTAMKVVCMDVELLQQERVGETQGQPLKYIVHTESVF